MSNQFLVLALRNLMRHRGRSLLALAAICIGVIALLLAHGFIEWLLWNMRQATIESRLGHIQVSRFGYQEKGFADPLHYLLPNTSPERATIEAMPGVRVVAPRLNFNGLISHGDVTVPFMGEGVDPTKEKVLSKYLYIAKGSNLSADATKDVILGQGLAAILGVHPGEKVVLLGTTGSGGMNAVELIVRGTFFTSSKSFDDTALRVPLSTAQKFLRVSGAQVWAILLDNTDHTDTVLQKMRVAFSHADIPLEFIPWYQMADFYNKTVTLFSRQVRVVWLIIAMIIVLSISNTLMMSVLERTGEIGTMMALGTKRGKIIRLFVGEGFLLGLIGGMIGVTGGLALARIISSVGIPMPPPPGMEVGFTAEILVTWHLAVGALSLVMLTTVVASVYPAWKASRMVIVDALRFNR